MKHCLSVGVLIITLFLLLRGARVEDSLAARFGRLPVQANGRVMPLDSLARQSLKILRGKSTARSLQGEKINSSAWLLTMLAEPLEADKLKVFRVDHPYVKGLIGLPLEEKYISFEDILPSWELLQGQFEALRPKAQEQDASQRALARLKNGLSVYQGLKMLLGGWGETAVEDYQNWESLLGRGRVAFKNWEEKKPYQAEDLEAFTVATRFYLRVSQTVPYGIVPVAGQQAWLNVGEALLSGLKAGKLPGALLGWATFARNSAKADKEQTLASLEELSALLPSSHKTDLEYYFHNFAPFARGCALYLLAVLLAGTWWLTQRPSARGAAWAVCLVAFLLHTLALLIRMYLQGRPPVTNLYSSALFVGWASAGAGLILERMGRQGFGVFVGGCLGGATLLIAHNLASSGGDTLEQLRAVLDANFWLSTHVIAITLGYSAMFLSGTLGILYACAGFVKPSSQTDRSLYRMAYGTICFALFFSFLGTTLGGIWADESWGRFWGWDPKENGALMIVLWCAILLHARWAKLIKAKGFMALAIGGNIVTAWSWFGVNLLGIGLHSYGFTEGGAQTLGLFALSQVACVALALKRPST